MHYTRHPLVESVLTAKSGYKLAVRPTKSSDHEEYLVDAIEIVSFGSAYFFRPTADSPYSFIVPVSDFEVVEVKEMRAVLKNVELSSRRVSIGAGADSPPQPQSSVDRSGKKKSRRSKRGGRNVTQDGGEESSSSEDREETRANAPESEISVDNERTTLSPIPRPSIRIPTPPMPPRRPPAPPVVSDESSEEESGE